MIVSKLGCVFNSVEKTKEVMADVMVGCDGEGKPAFWPGETATSSQRGGRSPANCSRCYKEQVFCSYHVFGGGLPIIGRFRHEPW